MEPKIALVKYVSLVIRPEGSMAWEYNPLYNYREDSGKYLKDSDGCFLSKARQRLADLMPFPEGKITLQKILHPEGGRDTDLLCTLDADSEGGKYAVEIRVRPEGKMTMQGKVVYISEEELRSSYTYGIGVVDTSAEGRAHMLADIVPLEYEEEGIIQDMITEAGEGLDFDLKHPVDIQCLQSFDGSTNLILTDNKNIPRLINTRFTPLEHNTYKRIDRIGNTDTNLYDKSEFALDTSLIKRFNRIPDLVFDGLRYGGSLSVGMYLLYFKLSDADGNTTDIIAESGNIPIFMGSIGIPTSIRGGQINEKSDKSICVTLHNIDSGYDYVKVFYSRTSAISSEVQVDTQYYEIKQPFRIKSNMCSIVITGSEEAVRCQYNDFALSSAVINASKTQAIVQNILFEGNVTGSEIDYEGLAKLSLEFLPFYKSRDCTDIIGNHQFDYEDPTGRLMYYNPSIVYDMTGYWPGEIYRLGIVYVFNDGSLSTVFNIRGYGELPDIEGIKIKEGVFCPFYKTEYDRLKEQELYGTHFARNPNIGACAYNNPYTETDLFVIDEQDPWINETTLENSKGVIRFPLQETSFRETREEKDLEARAESGQTIPDVETLKGNLLVYNLAIKVEQNIINELRSKHNVKGYFLVRQKRIPQVLAQAFLQGYELNSGTPLLRVYPLKDFYSGLGSSTYITETFIKTSGELPNDDFDDDECDTSPTLLSFPCKTKKKHSDSTYLERFLDKPTTEAMVAFCPDYEMAFGLMSSAFVGLRFPVRKVTEKMGLCPMTNNRQYSIAWLNSLNHTDDTHIYHLNFISVPDSIPAVVSDGFKFRGKAGAAEDASYVQCVNKEIQEEPTSNKFSTKAKKKRKNWLKMVALGVALAASIVASVYTCGAASPAIAATVVAICGAVSAVNVSMASSMNSTYDVTLDTKNPLKVALLRGLYGSYLGVTKNTGLLPGMLVNIYHPGDDELTYLLKYKTRFIDTSPYYPITHRISFLEDYNNPNALFTILDSKGQVEQSFNSSILEVFRGDCYINTFTHRMNRNFQDPEMPISDSIIEPRTWIQNWKSRQDNTLVNRNDINAVKLGLWVTFPVRSTMNLAFRDTDGSNGGEVALTGLPRGFYPYTDISVSGNNKIPDSYKYNIGFNDSTPHTLYFLLSHSTAQQNKFPTRIVYSKAALLQSTKNNLRDFPGVNTTDLPLQYGGITKLMEYGGHLMVIFEHGIGYLPVNAKVLLNPEATDSIRVGSIKVLDADNLQMLSTQVGSQWADSVIETQEGIVYGVDTYAKKIWKVQGSQVLFISDFSMQRFLNDNITFKEREFDPIIGVRNVKTHYNAYKRDVMFTYYDNTQGFEETVWNLCYNEHLGSWVTLYSWLPSWSANIHNTFFSFDRDTSKWITKLAMSTAGTPGKYLDHTTGIYKQYPKVGSYVNDKGEVATFKYFDTFNCFDTIGEGCVVDSPVIDEWQLKKGGYRIPLRLQNKYFPTGENLRVQYKFTLEKDNFGNYKFFRIFSENLEEFLDYGDSYLYIHENDLIKLKYKMLKSEPQCPVILLNIRCLILTFDNDLSANSLYNIQRSVKYMASNAGFYESPIALTVKEVTSLREVERASFKIDDLRDITGEHYTIDTNISDDLNYGYRYKNQDGLLVKVNKFSRVFPKFKTDFWKHGFAGLIDNVDIIKPCHWYGLQHPFEYEYITGSQTQGLKQFVNIGLLSNNVIPESIHVTVHGNNYDFSDDKRNMYVRLEATKAFYQHNGSDILYDHRPFQSRRREEFFSQVYPKTSDTYILRASEHLAYPGDFLRQDSAVSSTYKATILPLMYSKQDTFNEIKHFYKKATNHALNVDYPNLTGGEILYDPVLEQFDVCNHQQVRDMKLYGRTRGNALFLNDKWFIQISPLVIYLKNEDSWGKDKQFSVPPISLGNAPVPEDFNPVSVTMDYDGTVYLNDKTVDQALLTDGVESTLNALYPVEDNANRRVGTTSLERFLPEDIYKVGYKSTSQLDLTDWSDIMSARKEVMLVDSLAKIRVRYKGDKVVLTLGMVTGFNTI